MLKGTDFGGVRMLMIIISVLRPLRRVEGQDGGIVKSSIQNDSIYS